MANIAHPGSSRPAASRLDAVQLRMLRSGLLRTALFVGGFVAAVAVGGRLG